MTDQSRSENSDPKVIVIFAAKNEEYTIEKVITSAKQSYFKPEILVGHKKEGNLRAIALIVFFKYLSSKKSIHLILSYPR
jgi:hypothetical protein